MRPETVTRPAKAGDVLVVDGVAYRAVGWDARVDPPVFVYRRIR